MAATAGPSLRPTVSESTSLTVSPLTGLVNTLVTASSTVEDGSSRPNELLTVLALERSTRVLWQVKTLLFVT